MLESKRELQKVKGVNRAITVRHVVKGCSVATRASSVKETDGWQ